MPLVTRILVPIDFSAPSEGSARYAQAIARSMGSEVTLLHVMQSPEFEYAPVQITRKRMDTLLAPKSRELQLELEQLLADPSGGHTIKRILLKGDPAEQILLCARSEMADLIVLPTHGFDPVRRFLLGSTALKVLHGAEIPVCTGVHFENFANGTASLPARILCGLDLGPRTAQVLEWAAHLAVQFGAQLTVAHAAPDLGGNGSDFVRPDWRETLHGRLQEEVNKLKQAPADEVRIAVETGDPHKALSETVRRSNAGLLVIGRGTSEGLFGRLRANAYAIIRASPCPVLSV